MKQLQEWERKKQMQKVQLFPQTTSEVHHEPQLDHLTEQQDTNTMMSNIDDIGRQEFLRQQLWLDLRGTDVTPKEAIHDYLNS
jgi:hypothetical protein